MRVVLAEKIGEGCSAHCSPGKCPCPAKQYWIVESAIQAISPVNADCGALGQPLAANATGR
jgi:hypothetical protein